MERHQALCARIENDLLLLLGGELDPTAAHEVAEHLQGCAECRERERAARATQAARVAALDTVHGPGPDLWPALRAQLAREGRFRPAAETVRAPSVAAPRRAATGWWWAAAAALVLFGAWAVRGYVQQTGSGSTSGGDEKIVVEPRHGREPVGVQPVIEGGLRRVGRDERTLEESAMLLGGNEEPRLYPVLRPRSLEEQPASAIHPR